MSTSIFFSPNMEKNISENELLPESKPPSFKTSKGKEVIPVITNRFFPVMC